MNPIKNKYDVIVVGGGVNGVGIARDLALRGLSCLLVEKDDFSAGTSGASSGMIHGGPRYMLSDVGVTRLACQDSGFIQKIAPHLLFRIPFLYTVFNHGSRLSAKLLLEGVESFFAAYDKFVPLKNGKRHTRLSPKEVLEIEPNIPEKNLIGGVTFDEWGIDVARLCVANAMDAKENGADVLNHTEVIRVICDENMIHGIEMKDVLTGKKTEVSCQYLVNSTGPWSPDFAKMMGVQVQIRPSKGIHIVFERRLFNIAIVSQTIDGREIFVVPYENGSILGTTDDDFFGDLNQQRSTHDEIEYLLEGMEGVFPFIRESRMTHTYSGVRPTLYQRGCAEDDLSREHEIIDHEIRDGLKGAISLIGGKLASYRIMAEEVADLVSKKLGVETKSLTHIKHLPGGDSLPDVMALAKEYELDTLLISRLVYRHGSRAVKILNTIKENPSWSRMICACEPVTEAEVRYVVEHEMARTLSDVRRRTRLTQGPCQGTDCLIPASALLSEMQDGSCKNQKKQTRDFIQEWWWNRAVVLNADQLKQEEIYQALHFCNHGLDL